MKWLGTFWRSEDGNQTLSFVLMAPFLFWALCALYVYTDAFRIRSIVTDATTVLADTLSRQTAPIDGGDLSGLQSVAALLTGYENPDIRISQIRCIQDCESLEQRQLRVDFSRAIGLPQLNDDDLSTVAGRTAVPLIARGDRIVMTHLRIDYDPVFDYGIPRAPVEVVQANRPRFAPRLCWQSCNG